MKISLEGARECLYLKTTLLHLTRSLVSAYWCLSSVFSKCHFSGGYGGGLVWPAGAGVALVRQTSDYGRRAAGLREGRAPGEID